MSPQIVLDLTDLVEWYGENSNVTGIQRVVERLITSAAIRDDDDTHYVVRTPGGGLFLKLPKELVGRLSASDNRPRALSDLRTVQQLIRSWRRLEKVRRYPWKGIKRSYRELQELWSGVQALGVREFAFRRHDILIMPGTFWSVDDPVAAYEQARAAHDLRLLTFVYDLIPVTCPWAVSQDGSLVFAERLNRLLRLSDAFVVISRHVEKTLVAYSAAQSADPKPITILPMGWERVAPASNNEPEVLAKYGVRPNDFILSVGTIEPRKNQGLLVRAMHRLYGRLGQDLPRLVFVGKPGYGIEQIRTELAACGYLGDRLAIFHDVPDHDLAALYRGCRFTVFASFAEGWGLPVQESLSFGRACLASSATSIPEAGNKLATYFDPYDSDAFERLLEAWIRDPGLTRAAQARIAKFLDDGGGLPWSHSASVLMSYVRRLDTEAPARAGDAGRVLSSTNPDRRSALHE